MTLNRSNAVKPELAGPVPLLSSARALLDRYRVIFCDVWGVIHDGNRPYDTACDALVRFRSSGGTVVLVSNAPVPDHRVAAMLDERGVPRDAWDAIVSSGDIALRHVREAGYTALHTIGPKARDSALFGALPGKSVALPEAEAIICTGLVDDINETEEHYRPLLEQALAHDLQFICANPDKVVDVGGRLYLCAGAIADVYEKMGGKVYWCGKPHASAYDTAHDVAQQLRQAEVRRSQILAVGDSVRTDLTGAQRAGIDAIFIAAGIHREELVEQGKVVRAKLDDLLQPPAARPVAAMHMLAW